MPALTGPWKPDSTQLKHTTRCLILSLEPILFNLGIGNFLQGDWYLGCWLPCRWDAYRSTDFSRKIWRWSVVSRHFLSWWVAHGWFLPAIAITTYLFVLLTIFFANWVILSLIYAVANLWLCCVLLAYSTICQDSDIVLESRHTDSNIYNLVLTDFILMVSNFQQWKIAPHSWGSSIHCSSEGWLIMPFTLSPCLLRLMPVT